MSKYLTESLTWRLCVALCLWLRGSVVGRVIQKLGKAWRASAIYGFFARAFAKEPAMEQSAIFRMAEKSNLRLQGWGQVLRRGAEDSVICRAFRESRIFGFLFRNGFTGALLGIGAFYAIIDYLLRDVFVMEGIASVWDEAYMLLAIVWIFTQRMTASKPWKSRSNSMDLFVGFYLLVGVILLSCTFERAPAVHITGFRASMQYLLMFFITIRLIRDEADFMRMYRMMIGIAAVLALYGIYQYIVGVEIPRNWTDAAEGDVRTRVFAIFSNPNVMGGYMILFAPMTIGMAYAQENMGAKIFCWFCGLCMCVACLFTMSRGAWLGLAVAALIFSLIIDRKLFFILVLGGLFSCLLPFVQSRIGYLFTPEFQESNQRGGRGIRWARAFGYLTEYNAWPLGLGYGMYGGAVAMQNQIYSNFVYTYVDNYYVKTIAENGIVGISALLTMLSGLVWNGARACGRTDKTPYKPLCAGMLAALVGFLVQSFFECLWEEPYLMALYFVVAAMLIFAGFFREKPQTTEVSS